MPLVGRRRPLLRAAAVGGGAYYMGKRRARSEERGYEQDAGLDDQQDAAPESEAAPAPAPAGMSDDAIARLKQLGELHDQGILTDDEFAQQKAALLGS